MYSVECSVSSVSVGDVISHNGRKITVCKNDIKYNEFMGITVFGDSYNLGYKPVIKWLFTKPNLCLR